MIHTRSTSSLVCIVQSVYYDNIKKQMILLVRACIRIRNINMHTNEGERENVESEVCGSSVMVFIIRIGLFFFIRRTDCELIVKILIFRFKI